MPEQINIMNFLSNRAEESIQIAAQKAVELNGTTIDTEHLLLGVLEADEVAQRILKELKVDSEMLKEQIEESARNYAGESSMVKTPSLSPRTKQVLQQAFMESRELGHNYIGGEHILLGLIKEGEGLASQIFTKYGIEYTKARQAVVKVVGEGDETGQKTAEKSETPNLDKFSTDLTKMAYEGKIDPIIGRSDEITRVVQILSRRKKNNPVLIGEPGVGKTAIAEGLAYRISKGNVPEILKDKKIKELDIASLVAGAKFRGEFEERAQKVIKELRKSGESIILFIDELHTIVGSGAQEGQMDLSNMLKPSLARGELHVIGATTLSEYKKYIEKDAALERRFQPILVNEPSPEQTVQILKGLRDRYEAHHKVKISNEAINSAAYLSNRYIQDRFLPDKAIDLIDEAASKVRLESTSEPEDLLQLKNKIEQMEKERESLSRAGEHEKSAEIKVKIEKLREDLKPIQEEWNKKKGTGTPTVSTEAIAEVVSNQTGIPVTQLKKEDRERLLNLETEIHKRVVGQDRAVEAVSEAVRRSRVGLKDPQKPIGSFIFLGPTGVGKTLLAKTLAQQIFGDEEAMIRIDMSEYMEKFAVSRLIGSPPGYVGHEEGGQLTEAVRRQPYSVILLDEIEKAHNEVFNILLQLLDDGRLTDAKGRTVDFKNSIIISTSNIGSDLIMDYMEERSKEEDSQQKKSDRQGNVNKADEGQGNKRRGKKANLEENNNSQNNKKWEELQNKLMKRMKNHFKPEFLNRVDDIIIFKGLEIEQIKEIVKILLEDVKELVKGQGIKISFSDNLVRHLADIGYNPEFGARPIERVIQKEIENKLATAILEGEFEKNDEIHADYKDGKVSFKKA